VPAIGVRAGAGRRRSVGGRSGSGPALRADLDGDEDRPSPSGGGTAVPSPSADVSDDSYFFG